MASNVTFVVVVALLPLSMKEKCQEYADCFDAFFLPWWKWINKFSKSWMSTKPRRPASRKHKKVEEFSITIANSSLEFWNRCPYELFSGHSPWFSQWLGSNSDVIYADAYVSEISFCFSQAKETIGQPQQYNGIKEIPFGKDIQNAIFHWCYDQMKHIIYHTLKRWWWWW